MKTLHRSILALFVGLALTACSSDHVYADALQLDFFLAGFQDVSGAPLSGGIVVTKNSAASAAKAVWEDKDQTLPSAGGKAQFSLDSEGRAVVFGDGVYTVIIYDEADTGLTSPLYTFSGVTYQSVASNLDLKVDRAGDTITGDIIFNSGTAATPRLWFTDPQSGASDSVSVIDQITETWRVTSSYQGGAAKTPLSFDLVDGILKTGGVRILSTADEGDGNGLDADTVDGLHASAIFGEILGDGVIGRVMRKAQLQMEDGTNPSTIKATLSDTWNGDVIATTDNIQKDATTGSFTLSADGRSLSFGVTGNAVASLSSTLTLNSGANTLYATTGAALNDIAVTLFQLGATVPNDLTVEVDAAIIQVSLLYLTDE